MRTMVTAQRIPRHERGIVLVLFTIAMVAILGVAGLALDLGHAYLNKTRLQNALDAGALSGARTLNDNTGVVAAQTAALATFNQHLTGEMGAANPSLVPTIQFSTTLIPFVPGAGDADAKYIRLRVLSFPMTVWLARVLPGVGDTIEVGGSAVAGPSPPLGGSPNSRICDIAPVIVCAGKEPDGSYDTDCTDGKCFGYTLGDTTETTLKTGADSGWDVGPGNFQLIQLECGAGGDCVREELGGKYPGCAINGESVTTKPGNTVGPVAQGFNTRFGDYQGGMSPQEYPPDAVTYSDAGAFWYSDYLERLNNKQYDYTPVEEGGIGVPMRRVLAVPFGNCTGTTNGQGEVQVLGLGCFFMTRPTTHSGQTQELNGQFVDNCRATGDLSDNPAPGASPAFKIILYKDPDSQDS